MENKRRHWSHDNAESSNKKEYESEKQERKKMKITQDVTADCLISTYQKKVAKVGNMIKSRNVGVHANESSTSDDMNWGHKVGGDHVVEEAFSCIRPKDTKNSNSNSHLPLKIMCSVKEEERNERETREEIEKEKRREEQGIEKAEVEQMMALLAGERARAEFRGLGKGKYEVLDEERGLHSRAQVDVKNLLQGKSHSELEVLQSEIVSLMRYGLANVVEYWEPVLKRIHVYKAKAFLKEEIYDKILCKKSLDAGYDGKKDQAETEKAEGTGSSCSPEILHGEEIEDNFEMNTMDVMEEGDALSGNNAEVNLQSQVQWWQNICRSRKPKYFNRADTEYERNKCNQTHYDIIMAYYEQDSL